MVCNRGVCGDSELPVAVDNGGWGGWWFGWGAWCFRATAGLDLGDER